MDTWNRRHFLAGLGAVGAATLGGNWLARHGQAPKPIALRSAVSEQTRHERRLNILLIVTDQERSRADLPAALDLPAHDWLAEHGTSFTHYHANTTPCSPSARRTIRPSAIPIAKNGNFSIQIRAEFSPRRNGYTSRIKSATGSVTAMGFASTASVNNTNAAQ